MQAKSANLLTVTNGPKQFVIPIYQCTYKSESFQSEKTAI